MLSSENFTSIRSSGEKFADFADFIIKFEQPCSTLVKYDTALSVVVQVNCC